MRLVICEACMLIKFSTLRFSLSKLIDFMRHLLHYLQTRLQAQAAGVPYQGLCGVACFETNTVCMQFFIIIEFILFTLQRSIFSNGFGIVCRCFQI